MKLPTDINWISALSGSCLVFFICIRIFIGHSVSTQWSPDQTPHSGASDLDLHCLPMSHKRDARLIWFIKLVLYIILLSEMALQKSRIYGLIGNSR